SLTELNLEANKLTDIAAICEIRSLKVLNVSWNLLGRLHVNLARLSNLVTLTLAHNRLTHFPVAAMKALVACETIDIGYNEIGVLGDSFKDMTALTDIYVGHNQVKHLPGTLWF